VLTVEKNMNDLNERTNMMVMLIVVGTLLAAAIAVLLSVPSTLKSNEANVRGNNNINKN
jgi:ABC-type phosphate transport system permease subunit